jgi:hypothetical protein
VVGAFYGCDDEEDCWRNVKNIFKEAHAQMHRILDDEKPIVENFGKKEDNIIKFLSLLF